MLRPADEYVHAFTRDVNRARVLRAKSIMEPITSGENKSTLNDWPSIQAHARLADILPVALANGTSMTVRDAKDTPIGTLSPKQIVEALEG